MTLLQFSTYTSRGPWNSCIGLLQPQPPLSIACLEGSHCLQPWVLPPYARAEDPLGLEGMDLAVPDLMATSSLASLGEVMPEHIPSIVQVSHSPSPSAISKTLDVASISLGPPMADPPNLLDEVLWLQREMNKALEWLLMAKATLNSCQRELMWNANITTC